MYADKPEDIKQKILISPEMLNLFTFDFCRYMIPSCFSDECYVGDFKLNLVLPGLTFILKRDFNCYFLYIK